MPGIKKYIIVFQIIAFLLNSDFAKAQVQNSPKEDFILSAQGHAGYIIEHRNNMGNLIKGHIYGVELNYIFKTNGCKTWHQVYKYPELGLCYLHIYLSNPTQLGNLEAFYPYTNIRLNKIKHKTALNLRLATGICYVTKPFDRITNHQNEAIGSHLNAFVNLRLSTSTMLTKAWRLDAGAGLSHASNGAYETPNLGLNMVTVNLGLGYVFGNQACTYIVDSVKLPVQKWQTSVLGVAGIKELEDPGGKKYVAFSLQGNVLRGLNYKNSLGGGLEVFYNSSTKQRWAADSIYTSKPSDIIQAGAKICYAYNFHKLSFPVEFGVYFYKKQPVNGIFFHRIGFRYMLTKHLIANFTLLTHFAKADYFEWGLGYRF